jgi:CIC family chloride channel protein
MEKPVASAAPAPRRHRWLPEFLVLSQGRRRSQIRILGFSVLVGFAAGVAAVVFYLATHAASAYAMGALAGYRPEPRPAGESAPGWLPPAAPELHLWMLIAIPAVGGLLSGILVYSLAPEAEGHGTDSVIAAYHLHQGYMRPRVPLVKIVSSALTIGSGGSGGREGPIAQIGAGFGSALADLFRLRPSDRRVLLAAGMGAGIAAIFRAPLAGALFAAEVLYWSPEFEADVILPAAIASVIAYCTYGAVFGWTPLFAIPSVQFDDPLQLIPYIALAICMAILASVYTRTFYGITRLFHWLPIPRFLKPAIGALLAGSVGVGLYLLLDRNEQALAVLSFGYGAIQAALTDNQSMGAELLLAIALGKILTTSLTIGSGGSGGVFGPSMVIGGCGGGALGITMAQFWPDLVHPVSFVIVGMAGFFAAAAKTPFSTLIIVSEMTGGYQLLLPALWVCTISFMLSDEQSIYSAQVEGRAQSPAHQGRFVRDALSGAFVSQFIELSSPLSMLKAQDPLSRVLELFNSAADSVFPVVDDQQKLLGVIYRDDTHLVSHTLAVRPLVLAVDMMHTDVTPLTPDDTLERASEMFVVNDLPALPIVNNLQDNRVLGMVRRSDINSAYLRVLHGPRETAVVNAPADPTS